MGGIEKIAQAITNAVDDEYEMKVLCFTRAKEDIDDFVDNVEIIRCGTLIKMFSQPLSLTIIGKLESLVKTYNPDYIIIHEPNPLLTFWVSRIIGNESKLIVYWHSDIIKQTIGEKFLRNLYIKELSMAYRIVATSPNYIDGSYYLSKFKEKCVVVPNCIDEKNLEMTDDSHRMAEQIRSSNKGKIICVGVGRVVPYKGFEYLAQVSRILDDRFVFFISGYPGSSTKKIEKMVEKQTNFHLLGETKDCEQKAYLEAADIFVFPSISKNEAFGIALAEGMYFGKPAVTFTIDGSGVNFVNIGGETGIEVENRNIGAYADALLCLANDAEMRKKLGLNAKKRVVENFLFEQFRINISNVFGNIE